MVNNAMLRALDFLKNHKDVAFATCEGDMPKIRVMRIMKQEENRLYFATSEKKQVWQELRKNPNVEILASDGDVSVRCSGMVCFHVDDETRRWIYDHSPILQRLYSSYDQMAYFKLQIAEMDYYDLAPTPPIFKAAIKREKQELVSDSEREQARPIAKHFDLMTGETGDGFVGDRFSKK